MNGQEAKEWQPAYMREEPMPGWQPEHMRGQAEETAQSVGPISVDSALGHLQEYPITIGQGEVVDDKKD